eukprot:g398.t1
MAVATSSLLGNNNLHIGRVAPVWPDSRRKGIRISVSIASVNNRPVEPKTLEFDQMDTDNTVIAAAWKVKKEWGYDISRMAFKHKVFGAQTVPLDTPFEMLMPSPNLVVHIVRDPKKEKRRKRKMLKRRARRDKWHQGGSPKNLNLRQHSR